MASDNLTGSDLNYAHTRWKAADERRGQVDAKYKHPVLRGQHNEVSIFGQETNPTMWRLTHIRLPSHGIETKLGSNPPTRSSSIGILENAFCPSQSTPFQVSRGSAEVAFGGRSRRLRHQLVGISIRR